MPFLIAFFILPVLVFAGAYAAYRYSFYSPRGDQNNDLNYPTEEQYLPYREEGLAMIRHLASAHPWRRTEIRSRDGLRLSARLLEGAEDAPMALCMHGYRGTAFRDFSGGAEMAVSRGFTVLLPDQRAHGESGGHTLTLGVRERFDCVDWARWLERRYPGRPIFLYGISMGAATVLMATSLGLPGSVCGVIADSPYSSPAAIVRKCCRDTGVSDKLLYPFTALGARIFGGFSLSGADAAAAVAETDLPVLILHGEDDRFVPVGMSAEIARANPARVTRETFPGAGHGISFMTDRARYETLVDAFTARCLAARKNQNERTEP